MCRKAWSKRKTDRRLRADPSFLKDIDYFCGELGVCGVVWLALLFVFAFESVLFGAGLSPVMEGCCEAVPPCGGV
jgi:hypothetical protein